MCALDTAHSRRFGCNHRAAGTDFGTNSVLGRNFEYAEKRGGSEAADFSRRTEAAQNKEQCFESSQFRLSKDGFE